MRCALYKLDCQCEWLSFHHYRWPSIIGNNSICVCVGVCVQFGLIITWSKYILWASLFAKRKKTTQQPCSTILSEKTKKKKNKNNTKTNQPTNEANQLHIKFNSDNNNCIEGLHIKILKTNFYFKFHFALQ